MKRLVRHICDIVALTFGVTTLFQTMIVLSADIPALKSSVPKMERFRDGVPHFLEKLSKGEQTKIAYFGGSITAADGWRPMTFKRFQSDYPQIEFNEINAAIGGVGSDLGVFRLRHDVLQYDPDLVFVEFTVNDDGVSYDRVLKQIEGIVRQIWKNNLSTDIVFVYTFRTGRENDYNGNKTPVSVSASEMVADFYGIPSVDLNVPIVELAKQGKLVFQAESEEEGKILFSTDGVHPLAKGHQVYADVIMSFFEKMQANHASSPYPFVGTRNEKLKRTLVADNFENAKMLPITPAQLAGEWSPLPPDSPLSWIKERVGESVYTSDKPGSKLTIRFKGSHLSIYDVLGPNGGQVWVTVDGVKYAKPIPRFDSFCTYWRLATLSVASNLDPESEHVATIEIDEEEPSREPVAFRLADPEKELAAPMYNGRNVWFGSILIIGDVL